MPRLSRDPARKSLAQRIEECARDTRVELVARRQLHEQAPEPRAQGCEGREEFRKQSGTAGELPVVGDRTGDLHGEAKSAGHGRSPSLERGGAMRAMESRVYLHR